ncbi:MAG TPA: hypothetical protein VF841_17370 [Anaeromyxobacter sp.]
MSPWFKKEPTPPKGPDFSQVDSLAKALQLAGEGTLEKMYLMPMEFGGADIPQNVVYVPVGMAAEKARIDFDVVRPLIRQGKVTEYTATPEYQGRSFIPIAVRIVASSPGQFSATLNLWGVALARDQERGQRG